VTATARRAIPITDPSLTRQRSRVIYGVLAVVLLASILTSLVGSGTDWWPAAAFALGPDLGVLCGIAPGLARGQLHPRSVPLHNALHRFWGPLGLLTVTTQPDCRVPGLPVRSPGHSTSRSIARLGCDCAHRTDFSETTGHDRHTPRATLASAVGPGLLEAWARQSPATHLEQCKSLSECLGDMGFQLRHSAVAGGLPRGDHL
jgi:hypothetical protein